MAQSPDNLLGDTSCERLSMGEVVRGWIANVGQQGCEIPLASHPLGLAVFLRILDWGVCLACHTRRCTRPPVTSHVEGPVRFSVKFR